jgi:hypothetical protein
LRPLSNRELRAELESALRGPNHQGFHPSKIGSQRTLSPLILSGSMRHSSSGDLCLRFLSDSWLLLASSWRSGNMETIQSFFEAAKFRESSLKRSRLSWQSDIKMTNSNGLWDLPML